MKRVLTGKEEQISAIAIPTNQVKNVTRTQPHTRVAGPAYRRLEPYRGVIPVKSVIVENDIARVLNRFCKKNSTQIYRKYPLKEYIKKQLKKKKRKQRRKKKKKKRPFLS